MLKTVFLRLESFESYILSGMPSVRVYVRLKPSLLDSAGRTVGEALKNLGYSEVEDVRIGKLIELKVDTVEDSRIREMCSKLLANPVIEDFTYEIVEEKG